MDLLGGQIESHLASNAPFTYDSIDSVVGAYHGQGSFHAGVKLIYRKCNVSLAFSETSYALAAIK